MDHQPQTAFAAYSVDGQTPIKKELDPDNVTLVGFPMGESNPRPNRAALWSGQDFALRVVHSEWAILVSSNLFHTPEAAALDKDITNLRPKPNHR